MQPGETRNPEIVFLFECYMLFCQQTQNIKIPPGHS